MKLFFFGLRLCTLATWVTQSRSKNLKTYIALSCVQAATEICLRFPKILLPTAIAAGAFLDRIYEQITDWDGHFVLWPASMFEVTDKKSKNAIVTIMFRFSFVTLTHLSAFMRAEH